MSHIQQVLKKIIKVESSDNKYTSEGIYNKDYLNINSQMWSSSSHFSHTSWSVEKSEKNKGIKVMKQKPSGVPLPVLRRNAKDYGKVA